MESTVESTGTTLNYRNTHGEIVFYSEDGQGNLFRGGEWKKSRDWNQLYNVDRLQNADNILLLDSEEAMAALDKVF